MTAVRPDQFEALASLGAGDFAHLDGSLERHFIAVHDLLSQWGASDVLRSAGLFHAVYGTAGFDSVMVSLDRRSAIAAIIGLEAEQIAYRYCSCDRSTVWPLIGNATPVLFKDRFTGEEAVIDSEELVLFCGLTCANEVEIGIHDPTFVIRAGKYLHALFERWHDYLSEAAAKEAASTFKLPRR